MVPIQSVVTQEGVKVCYIAASGDAEKRQVEIGQFNNDFVEIKEGLAEGEKVLLNPPRQTEENKQE
jgi:HlyD family secretion protein